VFTTSDVVCGDQSVLTATAERWNHTSCRHEIAERGQPPALRFSGRPEFGQGPEGLYRHGARLQGAGQGEGYPARQLNRAPLNDASSGNEEDRVYSLRPSSISAPASGNKRRLLNCSVGPLAR